MGHHMWLVCPQCEEVKLYDIIGKVNITNLSPADAIINLDACIECQEANKRKVMAKNDE